MQLCPAARQPGMAQSKGLLAESEGKGRHRRDFFAVPSLYNK